MGQREREPRVSLEHGGRWDGVEVKQSKRGSFKSCLEEEGEGFFLLMGERVAISGNLFTTLCKGGDKAPLEYGNLW